MHFKSLVPYRKLEHFIFFLYVSSYESSSPSQLTVASNPSGGIKVKGWHVELVGLDVTCALSGLPDPS